MHVQPRDIEIKKKKIIRVRPFSDVHIFSEGHDTELFQKFVHEVQGDPDGMTICLDDLIEDDRPSTRIQRAVMYADKPEALSKEDQDHLLSLDLKVLPDMMKIAKSGLGCLGIVGGDHYRKYKTGLTSTQYICLKTGIPYLGDALAWVALRFKHGKQSCRYIINAQHGSGGTGTVGNDINKLEKTATSYGADLYLGAHTHKEWVHKDTFKHLNHFNEVVETLRTFVRCGTFLNTSLLGKTLYSEKKTYGTLYRGWPIIELTVGRDGNKNISVLDVRASI